MFFFHIQMTCFGVYFNFNIEYQYTWLCCSVAIVVTIVLTISLLFTPYDDDYANYPAIGLIYFYGSSLLEDSILILPSISFIVLLRSLHKRFIGLNSLLRFRLFFLQDEYFKVIFSHHFILFETEISFWKKIQ